MRAPSQELKERINELLFTHSNFKRSDGLTNVHNYGVFEDLETLNSSDIEFLLFHARKYIEAIGVNPVCISFGTITCEVLHFNSAPVFFRETRINFKNKTIEPYGELFLNPYIQSKLQLDDDHGLTDLTLFEASIRKTNTFIELETNSHIGLFHPFRFKLIKELMELKDSEEYSQNIERILNLEPSENQNSRILSLFSSNIIETNSTQEKAIKKLSENSILLHGPPGTGKTQLIASVIARSMKSDFDVIFTSQKKSAIDAVSKHLQNIQLDPFSLVIHEGKDRDKKIVENLKYTWDFLLNFEIDKINSANSQNDSSSFFKELFRSHASNKLEKYYSVLNHGSNTSPISTNSSKVNEDQIEKLFEIKKTFTTKETRDISCLNIEKINADQKNLPDPKELSDCFELLHKEYQINSKSELDNLVVFSVQSRYFESSIFKQYVHILTNHKDKFLKLYNKWQNLQIDFNQAQSSISNWKKTPSESELNNLHFLMDKRSFWSRMDLKFKLRKFLRQPNLDFKIDITNYFKYNEVKQKQEKVKQSFFSISIYKLEDLHLIKEIIDKIQEKDFKKYMSYTEGQKSILQTNQSAILKLNRFLTTYIIKKQQNNLKEAIARYSSFTRLSRQKKSILYDLNNDCIKILNEAQDIDHAIYSSITSFLSNHFENSSLPNRATIAQMIQKTINNIPDDKKNSINESIDIQRIISEKFKSLHELTFRSNRTLTEKEKELKSSLKIGKKILVHEFSKKRKFKSIRQLMETEAALWIKSMKPVVMMNPLQLSSFSPMKKEQFAFGIIDEASQMPLSHALGTLQRCQRVLIAGDENQIEPLRFFDSNSENDPSILHQAKYHLENIQLDFHYRSEDSRLIDFSNQHFYNGRLKVLEYAHPKNQNVIFDYYFDKAVYSENCNKTEAKSLVDNFISHYNQFGKKSNVRYAIISFSQSQLKAIEDEFMHTSSNLINQLQTNGKLILKPLDQVQGEEADYVFISLGYGKNKEGKFEMRFGPINLSGGEKRLNVLFTRAIKEIHFFSSVREKDFKKSPNLGVNMLKNWLGYIENMPKDKKVNNNPKSIHFFELLNHCNSAHDIVHLIKIYHQRGWKILLN